jgi:hypothetical protein
LDFSAAVLLFNATTEIPDRFWMKRYGPSLTSPLVNASAALKNFVRPPQKDFCNNIPSRADVARPPRQVRFVPEAVVD